MLYQLCERPFKRTTWICWLGFLWGRRTWRRRSCGRLSRALLLLFPGCILLLVLLPGCILTPVLVVLVIVF